MKPRRPCLNPSAAVFQRIGLRRPMRAQAMSEYLLILALIVGVFALPQHGGQALLELFAAAIGEGFARFLNALSIPL